MEADRRLPNAFDDIEDRSSLFSDSVAKNTAEQPDVVPQRPVLSRAFIVSFISAICSVATIETPSTHKGSLCSIVRCGACGDQIVDQRLDDSGIFGRAPQSPTAEPSERSYGVWPVNAGKARASTRHWWEPYAVGLQGAG